jgi:hypothetical protein
MLRAYDTDLTHSPGAAPPEPRFDAEVVEVPLLLPRWQALALESTASCHGLTTAQMLRQVISDLLRDQARRD